MATTWIDDRTWQKIEPLLPAEHYLRRVSNRDILDAAVYVLVQDLNWLDIDPEEWGMHGATVWRRFRMWEDDGVWDRIAAVLVDRVPGLDAGARERILDGRRETRAKYNRHSRGVNRPTSGSNASGGSG